MCNMNVESLSHPKGRITPPKDRGGLAFHPGLNPWHKYRDQEGILGASHFCLFKVLLQNGSGSEGLEVRGWGSHTMADHL